jgi:hypothetical protein
MLAYHQAPNLFHEFPTMSKTYTASCDNLSGRVTQPFFIWAGSGRFTHNDWFAFQHGRIRACKLLESQFRQSPLNEEPSSPSSLFLTRNGPLGSESPEVRNEPIPADRLKRHEVAGRPTSLAQEEAIALSCAVNDRLWLLYNRCSFIQAPSRFLEATSKSGKKEHSVEAGISAHKTKRIVVSSLSYPGCVGKRFSRIDPLALAQIRWCSNCDNQNGWALEKGTGKATRSR